MKLHSPEGPAGVLERHDDSLGGAGGHGEFSGQRVGVGDKRVIPPGPQGVGQPCEQPLTGMLHQRRATMHRLAGADDAAPQRLGHRLVPQAHPQHGNAAPQLAHHLKRDARLTRGARAGRDDDRGGLAGGDLGHRHCVVAHHLRRHPQFLEVAGQVEHEAVVVVDQQNRAVGHVRAYAMPNTRSRPEALCRVSVYSASGSDWATTPPPTPNTAHPFRSSMVRIRMLESNEPSHPR